MMPTREAKMAQVQQIWQNRDADPANVQKTLFQSARVCKRDFIAFILHYNKNHATEFKDLTKAQLEALKKLRELWNGIAEDKHLNYYTQIQEQNKIVNCGWLTGNALWAEYQEFFESWHKLAVLRFYWGFYENKQKDGRIDNWTKLF